MIFSTYRVKRNFITISLSLTLLTGVICKIFGIGFFIPLYLQVEGKYPNTNSVKFEKTEITLGEFKRGYIKNYFESGNLISEGYYKYNEKSDSLVQIFNWKFYHETGELLSKGKFSNNRKVGKWNQYFRNSKLATEGKYINGKYEGKWKYYYDDSGELKDIENYKNGILEGEKTEYYKSGKIKRKSIFTGGYEEGISIEYYENGNIKSTTTYKKGKNNGPHIEYHENGIKSSECIWVNENPLGALKFYDKKGKLKEEFFIDENGNMTSHNKYE